MEFVISILGNVDSYSLAEEATSRKWATLLITKFTFLRRGLKFKRNHGHAIPTSYVLTVEISMEFAISIMEIPWECRIILSISVQKTHNGYLNSQHGKH